MTKLIDLVSQESFDRIKDEFETAIQLRGDLSDRSKDYNPDSTTRYMVTTETDHEVGEAICRYVHTALLRKSKLTLESNWDYVFEGFVTPEVRGLFDKYAQKKQSDSAITSAIQQLRANNLIKKIDRDKWLLRKWPEGQHLREFVSPWKTIKQDPREEKRINQFKNQPVKETVDLKAIPFPTNITPEAMVDYVGKVVTAFKRQSTKLDVYRTRVNELAAENKDLREKLEAIARSEWDVAAARIKEMIGD